MEDNATQTDSAEQAQARTLGLARWVQLAYLVGGLVLFWLLDKVVLLTWEIFAEPDTNIASLSSLVMSAAIMAWLFKHETANRLTHEVVGELSKVAWPSRKETSTSTVVVIITSIIASIILGAFDAVWSSITDLIYKV